MRVRPSSFPALPRFLFSLLSLSCGAALPAGAQMVTPPAQPARPPAAAAAPAGTLPAAPAETGGTLVSIATTERISVPEDLLIATLRVEMEGVNPGTIQSEINAIMKNAVEQAKAVTGVEVSTDSYHLYNDGGTGDNKWSQRWRGSQSIILKSKDSQALLTLAGELQKSRLVMSDLAYTLSPEKREAIRDSLMVAAIEKLKAKTRQAADALGLKEIELREIDVDSGLPESAPVMYQRAAAITSYSKAESPVAEPGMAEITLTVKGRALLKP